jgi:hypothetical protein
MKDEATNYFTKIKNFWASEDTCKKVKINHRMEVASND